MEQLEYISEPAQKTPIHKKFDVLVIGGGPAGFSAAINAARQGISVGLIEQSGSVGGVATTGLMSHWTGSTRGGFYEEIIERSSDFLKENGKQQGTWTTINPEKLKTVMLNMLVEEKVYVRLYTWASKPIMDENKVVGVITESKSGREAFLAKMVIDATGDGDIAAKAGVHYKLGRDNDQKMQPLTLMFKVGGVDYSKAVFPGAFEDNREVPKGKIQDLGKMVLPFPTGHVLLYPSTLDGIATINMTNAIDKDGTNADDLTQAEIICRNQIDPIVDFLRNNVPGFENAYIISSASIIGVRETRHFEGEYTLTEKDIWEARKFDDWIVAGAHFNFDVHNISGSGLDSTGLQAKFSQKKPYTIPYRCFIPKKIDNLFLAGRNISGTHIAHSSYRVMPICANMGQAVGIAAALCVQRNIKTRELNVKDVQNILLKNGVELQ